MTYRVRPTAIAEVLLIEPAVHRDARGFFCESFNQRSFLDVTGLEFRFVQDNHSRSARNVLRGLHYQLPRPQGKLVRVVSGEIYDVAVDLRRGSKTFGRWVAAILSAHNFKQLWVPPGFAHGFLTLSHEADVLYKVTEEYASALEHRLLWSDPALAIAWPLAGRALLSSRDEAACLLKDAAVYEALT